MRTFYNDTEINNFLNAQRQDPLSHELLKIIQLNVNSTGITNKGLLPLLDAISFLTPLKRSMNLNIGNRDVSFSVAMHLCDIASQNGNFKCNYDYNNYGFAIKLYERCLQVASMRLYPLPAVGLMFLSMSTGSIALFAAGSVLALLPIIVCSGCELYRWCESMLSSVAITK